MKTSFFGFVLLAVLGIAFSASAIAETKNEKRPNILLIVVDDQSPYDLRIYNPKSELQTPTLDKLAAEGMVIDSARHMGAWVGAVCTSSRHMIMSGRTLWHIPDKGRKNNPHGGNERLVPPDLPEFTLPAVFNAAGYDTMRTCKTGNSYEAANAKFTIRRDAMKRGDTDETGSHWHAEQVLKFLNDRDSIRTSGEQQKPFLIYFGFSHPHDTRDGKPELLAKYGATNHRDKNSVPELNDSLPALPIGYLPQHPFHHGQPGLRDEEKVSGVWKNRDEATIRNETGREFACSENIDIQIARVLHKLKELDELDNTYIIYTADHGMAIGRHGLQGKQNLYEHTWRVPLIVKGPGVKTGRVPGDIYLLDLLATACDLAGIDAPDTNEGVSFKPVLEGERDSIRDVMYGCYCGGTKPGMRCIQKGDWKLIQYDVLNGEVREQQLFNLKENPHEFLEEHHGPEVIKLTGISPTKVQVNLASDPKHAQKLAEMESLLLAEMRRLDDPYRFWNQPDDGLKLPEPSRSGANAAPKQNDRSENKSK